MVTTRSRRELRRFQGSRSPAAALALAALVATLFGVSGVSASMTPGVAPATASGARLISDPRFAVTPVLDSRPYLTVQDGVVVPPSSFSATGAVDFGAQNFRGAQDFRAAGGGSSFAVTPVLDSRPYLTVQDGVVVPPSSFVLTPALDASETYLTIVPCRLSGGFSTAPGMSPDTSGPSAPTLCDPGVPGLPADRGTPSGGFSTAVGMSPDTAVAPSVAAASGAGVSGDRQVEPVSAGMTGADPCGLRGGFSTALGMSPDTSGPSALTPCDRGEPGLPAGRGAPSGGFSSALGMSPDTSVPSAQTKQP